MKGLITTQNKLKVGNRVDVVNQRIERKLFTLRGTVLGKKNIGSDLLLFFYEPATIDNAREMLRIVEEIVNEESDIVAEDITVAYVNMNQNERSGVVIRILYYFADEVVDGQLSEASFFRLNQTN